MAEKKEENIGKEIIEAFESALKNLKEMRKATDGMLDSVEKAVKALKKL